MTKPSWNMLRDYNHDTHEAEDAIEVETPSGDDRYRYNNSEAAVERPALSPNENLNFAQQAANVVSHDLEIDGFAGHLILQTADVDRVKLASLEGMFDDAFALDVQVTPQTVFIKGIFGDSDAETGEHDVAPEEQRVAGTLPKVVLHVPKDCRVFLNLVQGTAVIDSVLDLSAKIDAGCALSVEHITGSTFIDARKGGSFQAGDLHDARIKLDNGAKAALARLHGRNAIDAAGQSSAVIADLQGHLGLNQSGCSTITIAEGTADAIDMKMCDESKFEHAGYVNGGAIFLSQSAKAIFNNLVSANKVSVLDSATLLLNGQDSEAEAE